MSRFRTHALGSLALLLAACQVTPNTGETTPPTLTVTVTDKLNANAQTVVTPNGLAQYNPQFNILIAVSAQDPGGMQQLSGNVSFFSNSCADGAIVNGYSNPLATLNIIANQNPPNTVTDTLPYLLQVTTAQVQALPCGAGPQKSSGIGSIVVQLQATNAALRSAGGTYIVRIGNGALPQQ